MEKVLSKVLLEYFPEIYSIKNLLFIIEIKFFTSITAQAGDAA